jgi:hypothetical protein
MNHFALAPKKYRTACYRPSFFELTALQGTISSVARSFDKHRHTDSNIPTPSGLPFFLQEMSSLVPVTQIPTAHSAALRSLPHDNQDCQGRHCRCQ